MTSPLPGAQTFAAVGGPSFSSHSSPAALPMATEMERMMNSLQRAVECGASSQGGGSGGSSVASEVPEESGLIVDLAYGNILDLFNNPQVGNLRAACVWALGFFSWHHLYGEEVSAGMAGQVRKFPTTFERSMNKRAIFCRNGGDAAFVGLLKVSRPLAVCSSRRTRP